MIHRRLGKTNLQVGVVGLGTEYLNGKSTKVVVSVIREAIEKGVNYFDLPFAFPEYRDNLGISFKGSRDRVIIAGHIGCAETNGQYRLTRDVKENDMLFHDLLSRLRTDYVDIVMIQMVNEVESYDQIVRPGGLMELVYRFRREGKARHIGISGHKVPGVMRFIEKDIIDVLMFPINMAWDLVPGRKDVFLACMKKEIGLIAMKPFAGGRLFQRRKSHSISPVKCINYALAQPGVTATVPGVKNSGQLKEALFFLEANGEEREFGSIIADFQEDLKGHCVYCNHCLPCPAGIDIGQMIKMVDRALHASSRGSGVDHMSLQKKINFYYPGRIRIGHQQFKHYKAKASECCECGICMERCPFEVDVISKIKQAIELSKDSKA